MSKVTFCSVVLNRLEEIRALCRRVSPFVDRTCILDGGSEDGTIEWLSSQEAKDLKIEFKVSKQYRYAYGNHTPNERNQYLQMAGNDGWILVLDSDEFLEEEACKNLKTLVEKAEAQNIDGLMFQAHDLWSYEDGQVYDNKSNYWHHSMLFKAYPGMKYQGHTHAGIVRPGAVNRWAKTQYEYLHVKTERMMWRNSTYLWWTTAKNADNVTDTPEWLQFHELMRRHGHIDWHEFRKVMEAGNLDPEIKKWFIENKDNDNPEMRAWFMHYFIFLHPNENIDKLSNRDREWDYLEQCRLKKLQG